MSVAATSETGSEDNIVKSFDTKLITGNLLWHETQVVAEFVAQGLAKKEIRDRVLEENLLNRKTQKTAANIFSYLYQRITSTSPAVIELIANADAVTSKQATLVAAVSSSRILREFFRDVVSEKLESMNPTLRPSYWRNFWRSCIAQAPELEKTREKTVDELRHKCLSFLVDFGILNEREGKDLLPFKLTPKVARAVNESCSIEVQQSLRALL